jgi:hypothetical protein
MNLKITSILTVYPGREFFTSSNCPDRLWGPRSLLLIGYQVSSPEVKLPGSDVRHSSPFITKAKSRSELSVAYRGGGGLNLPPNSEVLTKLSRIPSSVENTSVTTSTNMGSTHLQIERNP